MMPDGTNSLSLHYPLTKMSFVVDFGETETAAFSEVTGVESTVDVIEFRTGNANTLSVMKMPGLVKHGNVTMKFGLTNDTDLIKWFFQCVDSERSTFETRDITITLIDTTVAVPSQVLNTGTTDNGPQWILKDAWITKVSMPDLDAKTSDIAIASIDVAYERLILPGSASNNE